MPFNHLRREYKLGGLRRKDLKEDPVSQFLHWQDQAIEAGLTDPTGCVLATCQPDGSIRQRMILMKNIDAHGLVFFTNYKSAKATAIALCDQASVLFPWNEIDRQVSVSGRVLRIEEGDSDTYFASRPREAQLSAWASLQSQEIKSRSALLDRLEEVRVRFEKREISRPPYWGGYRLVPDSFEFWQGGEDRLHDRFCYFRTTEGWQISRLQP